MEPHHHNTERETMTTTHAPTTFSDTRRAAINAIADGHAPRWYTTEDVMWWLRSRGHRVRQDAMEDGVLLHVAGLGPDDDADGWAAVVEDEVRARARLGAVEVSEYHHLRRGWVVDGMWVADPNGGSLDLVIHPPEPPCARGGAHEWVRGTCTRCRMRRREYHAAEETPHDHSWVEYAPATPMWRVSLAGEDCQPADIEATSAREAARKYVAGWDWRLTSTVWTTVRAVPLDADGSEVEDGTERVRVPVHPPAPPCDGDEQHRWHKVREYGRGPGVATEARCRACGRIRVTGPIQCDDGQWRPGHWYE